MVKVAYSGVGCYFSVINVMMRIGIVRVGSGVKECWFRSVSVSSIFVWRAHAFWRCLGPINVFRGAWGRAMFLEGRGAAQYFWRRVGPGSDLGDAGDRVGRVVWLASVSIGARVVTIT